MAKKTRLEGPSSGSVVWIPAQVSSGMFPDERFVRADTSGTTVSGFVPASGVKEEPRGYVRAVVMESTVPDKVALIFGGEILTTSNPVLVPKKWLSQFLKDAAD